MSDLVYIKFSVKNIFLFYFLIFSFGNLSLTANSETEFFEILLIGNSHTSFNQLPLLLNNLASSAGKEVHVDSYAPPGTSLYAHSNDSLLLSKIKEKKWDFIVLQGTGARIAYPETFTQFPVDSALLKLKELIHNNCISTRIILFMSWADEDGMTWMDGWTQSYEELQIDIYNKIIEYSDKFDFTIAPVGWAWYNILEEKKYPEHYLHSFDWSHAKLNGTFLAACVIYSTIFIESTVDITYYPDLELTEANYFKAKASDIVLKNKKLWKIKAYDESTKCIDSTSTVLCENVISPKAFLGQNHPNPFSSVTKIEYELFEESKVQIQLFGLFGEGHTFLVNEKIQPGNYTIVFDGSHLKSGVYFYTLETDKSCQIKKMQIIK